MSSNRDDWIDELIEAQQPGFSLDQAFYQDPSIFRRDCERVLPHHWIMAGHVSQIPDQGDYELFDVAGESIILIRGREGSVHAHYNVCRHRGSRVLLRPCGNARTITCGYHGWSYAQDGSLRAAPRMPEDFEPSTYGLEPCHLKVIEGLIFINLAEATPPGLDEVQQGLVPFLELHGIAAARVALREVFAVNANWKLAVENYLECYHCKPAHREYCRVEIKADRIADGSAAAMARYDARYREWLTLAEKLGTMLADFGTELPLDERLPRAQFGAAYRAPLRKQYLSGTEDGQAAAPLMGAFREYDGGETALGLGPFTYMLAYNDYAAFFQFVPRAAEQSEIIATWLVRGDARENEDYDPQRLAWLWTVTTRQDKDIIEANAAGIRSARYQPGPASPLESDVVAFREWYLAVTGPESRLDGLTRSGGGRYFRI
jgi:phenylpropionate dioxygenase-like ring-hydroxylating dioxygenase large terminal subunit